MYNVKVSKSKADLGGATVDAIVHHVRAAPSKYRLDKRCTLKTRRSTRGPACVMWSLESPAWDCCRWNRGLEPTDQKSYSENFDFGLTYKLDHQHVFAPYKGF